MAGSAKQVLDYFLQPIAFFKSYKLKNARFDVVAGLTVSVVLLPQAIAYAQIADLPPEFGLHAGIVAAIIGSLWGSSNQLQTGPTNAISLIVLSTLAATMETGSTNLLLAAGLLAVMAGVIQLILGIARLGVLVNFVSHSVVVGFTAGAAFLIGAKQIKPLLGLDFTGHSHGLPSTIAQAITHIDGLSYPTLALGVGSVVVMVVARLVSKKVPAALCAMVGAAIAVFLLGLTAKGVAVIGELPRGLPPVADIPFFDVDLIRQLSTGALAIAAIGLTEAMSIARSISGQTGQRLDSNQELIGQGLANIASGVFSGYAGSGSFSRSAVGFRAGARTPMAGAFTGVFVLLAVLLLAPLAAYVPKASLAGVLILTAYFMIDRAQIVRIWRGTRGDAIIMVATFAGTLLLPIEFAVLLGIMVSFVLYIKRTSTPNVFSVVPDDDFHRLVPENGKPVCPQLGILDIEGDLYFGAVHSVEEAIHQNQSDHPEQRFLAIRLHAVNQCDFSGIHSLEAVLDSFREQGGDLFFTSVHPSVRELMDATGFTSKLGADNLLSETGAIDHLFRRVLDPAVCIYECDVRVFHECKNLPKQACSSKIPVYRDVPKGAVQGIEPQQLWHALHTDNPPLLIDVREPREFIRGHIDGAKLVPLPKLMSEPEFPRDRHIVFVCRGGRRSLRAAFALQESGHPNVSVVEGGMLAWEAAFLLEAVDRLPTGSFEGQK